MTSIRGLLTGISFQSANEHYLTERMNATCLQVSRRKKGHSSGLNEITEREKNPDGCIYSSFVLLVLSFPSFSEKNTPLAQITTCITHQIDILGNFQQFIFLKHLQSLQSVVDSSQWSLFGDGGDGDDLYKYILECEKGKRTNKIFSWKTSIPHCKFLDKKHVEEIHALESNKRMMIRINF